MSEIIPDNSFIAVSEAHLAKMLSWFATPKEVTDWGGSDFEYPLDLTSVSKNLKLRQLNNYSLIDPKHQLLGFGRCYKRHHRCHLARLVINPACRGRGLITELMIKLIDISRRQFNAQEASLFVIDDNHSALSAYRQFGFLSHPYPGRMPLKNCRYMVKTL